MLDFARGVESGGHGTRFHSGNGVWKTGYSILLRGLEPGRRQGAQFCSGEWRLEEDNVLDFAHGMETRRQSARFYL